MKISNLLVRYALQVKFGYARTYKCERFSEAFCQKNFSVSITSFISFSTGLCLNIPAFLNYPAKWPHLVIRYQKARDIAKKSQKHIP